MQVKKGDIVGRYSYNNDILFFVDKIIKLNKVGEIAILKGLNIRIEADAPIEDLKKFDVKDVEKIIRGFENKNYKRVTNEYDKTVEYTGRILHLDGDTHLSNQKKYSNTNTSEQVIFNHNKNNVSKIKIHYFFITKREEFCEREHI